MNTEFHYHHLIEAVRKQGRPKNVSAKNLFFEVENWAEVAFKSDEERSAANRVGIRLFKVPHYFAVMIISLRLYKKSRKAFREFKALVDREVQTRAFELEDCIHEAVQSTLEAERRTTEQEEIIQRTKTFSREEFYCLVWSTPAKTLSADLGISDVMIGKICKKHKIPKPYPGYWAKYYAGHYPRRTSLPHAPEESRPIRLNKFIGTDRFQGPAE